MPFNGSGLFTRNYNWVNDRNSNIPITASRVDADSNDFANGLSLCVTRDSQGPASSRIITNGVGATPFTGAIDTAAAILVLNKGAGAHNDAIYGMTNNSLRWTLQLGNTNAEAGGNSGSNASLDRYSDTGTYIDSPITIARNTGVVTINNLVANALSAPPSTPSSLALTGSLSVGTTSSFTGGATFHSSVVLQNAASAWYTANNTTRSYLHGMSSSADSNYYICYDQTAAQTRAYITSAGAAVFTGAMTVSGNLTCSGNFNTNAIAGTTGSFSGALSAAGITGTNLQINGGNIGISSTAPVHYWTANGVRQWYQQASNNGTFYFVDGSSSLITAQITGGNGQWTFSYPTTCNSNLTVGGSLQVNGNTNTSATTTCNALVVNGSCTINPTIACNAISCSSINTNGNDITAHHVSVVDGVNYSNLGGHIIGFNNSGLTLTFSALGGSSGSWTFNPSDIRYKTNIGPTQGDALADLNSLQLISFDVPSEDPAVPTAHFNYGFSAQNVQSMIHDGTVADVTLPDGKDQLVLDSLSLISRCVGAIQQLTARVAALEAAASA